MEDLKYSVALQHRVHQTEVEGLCDAHKLNVKQLRSTHSAELELKDSFQNKNLINEVVPCLFGALCLSYHYRFEDSRISRKTTRTMAHYVFLSL